jgi:hypothetical protein
MMIKTKAARYRLAGSGAGIDRTVADQGQTDDR